MSVTRSAPARLRRNQSRRLLLLVPLVAMALGGAVLGSRLRSPDGQIAAGVHAAQVDLSNKKLDEARAALAKFADERAATTVYLHFPPETGVKRAWKTTAGKLGLGIDVAATLDMAAKANRSGVVEQVTSLVSGGKTVAIMPQTMVDAPKLHAYLVAIAHTVNRKGKNARLIPGSKGGFSTRPGQSGIALDLTASAQSVGDAWKAFNQANHAAPAAPPVENISTPAPPTPDTANPNLNVKPTVGETSTPTTPGTGAKAADEAAKRPADTAPDAADVDAVLAAQATQPAVTEETLKQVDGELAEFTTYYRGIANRLHNVELAASHINGTLIAPGETFSYNRVVGPRSESAGFRTAPEIVQGKHKTGVGGGVCQVSSTLYNAVLLSDLKVVMRGNHAFPIGYVPTGRDATVVYGERDFQFENNTPAPLYISAYASHRRQRLTFAIYGKRSPGKVVRLVEGRHVVTPAPVETLRDPSLYVGRRVLQGEPGKNGHSVTWYRITKENGQIVRRDTIRSYYAPVPFVYLVGSKPRPVRAPKNPTVAPIAGTPAPDASPAASDAPAPTGGQ